MKLEKEVENLKGKIFIFPDPKNQQSTTENVPANGRGMGRGLGRGQGGQGMGMGRRNRFGNGSGNGINN